MRNMKTSIAPLLAFFFFLSLLSINSIAEDVYLNTTEVLGDTTLYNYTSGNWRISNAGNYSIMQLEGVGKTGYIKFNLSSLPAGITITSAILQMDLANAGSDTVKVYNTSLYNSSGAGPWAEGNCAANPSTCYCSGSGCLITANMTFNNRVSMGALQDTQIMPGVGHIGQYQNFSVTEAVKTAYSQTGVNQTVSFMLNSTASAVNFYSKSVVGASPNLIVTYAASEATCGACGIDPLNSSNCYHPIVGSYCLEGEPTFIFTTSADCTQNDIYDCPLGTICQQITPQVNITTALVENVTDYCFLCVYAKYQDLNLLWHTLWTNCPLNPECDTCNGVVCQGHFYSTNLTSVPVSANYYTAGCYNPDLSLYVDVLNYTGGHTNLTDLTNAIFNTTNYTYNVTCANTSTTCYDTNCFVVSCSVGQSTCTSWADSLALGIGSAFGITSCQTSQNMASIIITLIVALVITIALAYYGGISDGITNVFTFSSLIMLVLFTMIGWFPAWLIVMLIVISALMVSGLLTKMIGGG